MIGSASGEQYESLTDMLMAGDLVPASHIPKSDKLPISTPNKDQSRVPPVPGQAPLPPPKSLPYTPQSGWNQVASIDRDHHVPLVASALTDDGGQMYGMAIDHRIPEKPEYEKHLLKHEAYENDYMNDLTKIGYSSQDAYYKAHDWSTARESAAVEAEFGKDGLEKYKQHWRDAASIAAEPSDRDRHPHAHTTRHGLDESELGQKFADAAENKLNPLKELPKDTHGRPYDPFLDLPAPLAKGGPLEPVGDPIFRERTGEKGRK